jgi:Tryptophan-associated transmembrane protein (Trp_oprn_chp)
MTRRLFGLTLLACLAGSGLALYAVTRPWWVVVTSRAGLPALHAERTGADAAPWLIGLALVALAGTGALLATAGRWRRALGVLLVLVGAGVTAGAIAARVSAGTGGAGAGGTVWPVACGLGGAIIVGGGLSAARHGHRWPTMSARYDRQPSPPDLVAGRHTGEPFPSDPVAGRRTGEPFPSDPAAGRRTGESSAEPPLDRRAAWDALDRGDDPTA